MPRARPCWLSPRGIPVHIDATNLQILDHLQRDARMSIADLARVVNRAESTVRERVAALETSGVIQGYQARIDHASVGRGAHGVLYASCDLRRLPDIVRRLATVPQVVRVLHTTGRHPLVIEVVAEDLPALERLLETRIAEIGFDDLNLSVVVNEHLPWRPLRLSGAVPTTSRPTRPLMHHEELTVQLV